MRIRAKLAIGFLAVLAAGVPVLLVSLYTFEATDAELQALKGDVVPSAIAMAAMERACCQAQHHAMEYILHGREEDARLTRSSLAALVEAGAAHLEHDKRRGPQKHAVARRELPKKIRAFQSAVLGLMDRKKRGEGIEVLLRRDREEVHPLAAALGRQAREHMATHMLELAEAEMAVGEAHRRGILAVLLGSGCVLLVAAVAVVIASKRLVKPLQILERSTREIAQGRLDYRTAMTRNDEIGQLSRSFDAMADALSNTLVSKNSLEKSNRALEAEVASRERAEERFRVLFESSRDAIMTLAPPSWRFTSGNPAALAMFGAEDEEAFTELGPWDVSPETQPDGRPSAEKAREMIETAVREGSHFFEWTHLDADGEPFPATVLLARMEVAGQTVVQATVRDVTERKRAEETLREEREKLAKIAGSAQDAIVMMDADGNVSFWNRAAETIFGYTEDEALGKELHRLMAPERFHEAFRKGFAHFQQSGEGPAVGRTLELVGRRKDGQEVPIELSMSAVRLRDAWHAIGIVRDVTDRKRAEEVLAQRTRDLERSNAELQAFAYVASHDLQEPLRMVASYVQLLERRYADALDDDAREFIGYAADGAKRMQDLINDLLAYSRVGTKGKPFAPTDCEALLEEVLSNLEVAIKESGARITHDPLPQVMADEGQLARVFQNLIGNALKFCDQAPEVHVSAEKADGQWRFSVRDNGIGIEPDQQEKIFVVFQRLHRRDEYAGTGIGLAITKKIVERHGGRIWVESEPGRGSTFYFTIPERKEAENEHEHGHGNGEHLAVACPSGGDSAG